MLAHKRTTNIGQSDKRIGDPGRDGTRSEAITLDRNTHEELIDEELARMYQ
jgi:hypothetical protein